MFTTKTTTLGHTPLWSSLAAILGLPVNKDITVDSLFKNGELGWYYDFNDLSTLFQDAFGTIPVTGENQMVGLVLDKSRGLTRSAEKLSDSNWTLANNWTKTGSTLSCAGASQNAQAIQYGVVEANCMYEITFTVNYVNYGMLAIALEGSWIYNVPSEAGRYRIFITADQTGALYLRPLMSATTASISDISCKQIYGNHAYQVNVSYRPVLVLNRTTGYHFASFSGYGTHLQTNKVDLSTVNTMSSITSLNRSDTYTEAVIFEFSRSVDANDGSFSLTSSYLVGTSTYNNSSKGTLLSKATGTTDKVKTVVVTNTNIATSLNEMEVNDVTYQSSTSQGTGNYGFQQLYIGSRYGRVAPFKGDMYSLLAISRTLTPAELAQFKGDARNAVGV